MNNKIMDFAVHSLKKLSGGNRNMLFSPVSALAVLAVLQDCAKGKTRRQIERVVGSEMMQILEECLKKSEKTIVEDEALDRDDTQYKASEKSGKLGEFLNTLLIDDFLCEGEPVQINFANAILIKDDEEIHVNEDFIKKYREDCLAEIIKTQFDEMACSNLNQWISEKTNGQINNAIKRFPKDIIICVLNALAFNAAWENKFDNMGDRSFKFDGKESVATFLYSEESRYIEDEDTTGFMKPYEGDRYSFVALLPYQNMTLDEYISILDGEKLSRLLKAKKADVDVVLPKLKVEDILDLKPALVDMGITDAFNETADFSAIATADNPEMKLYIDSLTQQTKLELDEKGTRAAAFTMAMMTNCLSSVVPKRVILDRPFLYLIIENNTKLPMFIGTVKNDEVLCICKDNDK